MRLAVRLGTISSVDDVHESNEKYRCMRYVQNKKRATSIYRRRVVTLETFPDIVTMFSCGIILPIRSR